MSRPVALLFGLAAVVCLLAVAAPEYAGLGNRIEPRILGVPFSLMWNVGWVGLSFIGLGLFHWLTGGERTDQ